MLEVDFMHKQALCLNKLVVSALSCRALLSIRGSGELRRCVVHQSSCTCVNIPVAARTCLSGDPEKRVSRNALSRPIAALLEVNAAHQI